MELQGTPIQYVAFILLIAAGMVQAWYYFRYYLKPARHEATEEAKHIFPVSVIICARNEAINLKQYLPSILGQDHPDFEVIVVNDCSEDETDMVLAELKTVYPRLKISTINKDPRFLHNKKLAQLIGIKAAKNEILLLTDADCQPESETWLRQMTAPLADGKEIVLGYGGYFRAGGLLNSYIRYDTMFIAMQYTGLAMSGLPYMGVGRNLAYRKDLFMRGNGFSSHYHIPSGDDDLFVNANATAGNTSVVLGSGSFTRSVPATSLKQFIRQKRRHMTTANHYRFADRLRLLAEPLSRVLFLAAATVMIAGMYLWPVAVSMVVAIIIVKIVVFHFAGQKFGEKGLTIPAIFYDICSPIFNALFYIAKFGKQDARKAWR